MTTNPNDSAHPYTMEEMPNGWTSGDGYETVQYPDLTKREYFAAKALQGIIANQMPSFGNAAKDAVRYADALIEELNKANP